MASSSLEKYCRRFEEAEQSSYAARALAVKARQYYDGKQLTEAEEEEIRKCGQMPGVYNRIRRKIDWLLGLELQSRTDPKAFPRNPEVDEGAADAATDALRYVADDQDFDKKRSRVWENMLIEGLGGVEIIHNFRPPMAQPEIIINRYAADRLFYDPHSMEPDFSDSRYHGAVIWSDADDLIEQFPGKADEIEASFDNGGGGDDYEDKPMYRVWSDSKRKRVRVVLMHHREGGMWKWVQFVKGGILDEGESEYVDDMGESLCPMELVSAYVSEDGERYGVIRDMFAPQDEINIRRRKGVALINERQTVGIEGAVDVLQMKKALRNPRGHVSIKAEVAEAAAQAGAKAFEIIPTNDMAAGNLQMLQEAKTELDLMGANSGLAGKGENDPNQSGRALMARQQGGLIEIAPMTDRLSDFTRRVYRQIWCRVKQYWNEETWIRITDDEKNVRFVGLNRKVTLGEKLSQIPPEQAQAFMAQNMMGPNDPRMSTVLDVENDISRMDVDIIIEEAPDQVTLQAETFQQVVQISTSQPGAVPPDILIEMAPGLPRDVKDKLIERLTQQQQQQGQMGVKQAQMAEQKANSEALKAEASATKDFATAAKTQAETVTANIEAEQAAIYGVQPPMPAVGA